MNCTYSTTGFRSLYTREADKLPTLVKDNEKRNWRARAKSDENCFSQTFFLSPRTGPQASKWRTIKERNSWSCPVWTAWHKTYHPAKSEVTTMHRYNAVIQKGFKESQKAEKYCTSNMHLCSSYSRRQHYDWQPPGQSNWRPEEKNVRLLRKRHEFCS